MRFVIAIVLFVVAFVGIAVGIAQRTVFAGPDSFTTSVTTGDAPVTIVDSDALRAFTGTQKVTVSGDGDIFLAYGRSTDVQAWVGDASFNEVTFDVDKQKLAATSTTGTEETPLPSPVDSDLWSQEFTGKTELIRKLNAPTGISLIIMADGTAAAPDHLTITWPLDNSAPMSGPLIVGGIGALVAGLLAFIWALVHARSRRGPRRKQPRLPRPPAQPRLKRGKNKELEVGPQTGPVPLSPPQITTLNRRRVATASVLVVASLALAGCTTGPIGGASPTPSSTSPADDLLPPAVTEQQLARIVDRVTESVTAADAAKDAKLAADRLDGPALALRTANYKVTTVDATLPVIAALPTGDLRVVLPQQNKGWPRSVFTVIVPSDSTIAPVALMLVQDSARDNYKVHYLITLEPDVKLPEVAPAQIGAVQLQPDSPLAVLPPDQLAAAYGEILLQGEKAPNFDAFQADGDSLRTAIGAVAKAAEAAAIPATAKIEFTNGASDEPPIALATNDSGQLVAVSLDDTEKISPVEAGAAINSKGAVKALSGRAQSTKGFLTTYGVQLLFYVPPVNDTSAKIQLLGFSQGIVSSAEIN